MESVNQEPLDEALKEAARDYNRPPNVPRDEMWARIEAVRRTVPSSRRWVAWGVGIAATLALGIGIGRLTVPSNPSGTGTPIASAAGPAGGETVALRVAATQHLSQAEAFLTGFRSDQKAGSHDGSFSSPARELLSTTRLLLDSPDLRDPRTRGLLEDLELVLAQISQLQAGQGIDEVDLITQGLNQRGLLPRLRSAIPAGPAAARARGEL